jgi:hypothetical protein
MIKEANEEKERNLPYKGLVIINTPSRRVS